MSKISLNLNGSYFPVELRFLCPNDVPLVRQLCEEWFPIAYPHSWFEEITSNPKFYALAAMIGGKVVGLIVAEIKQQVDCNREDQGLLSKHFSKATPVAYILTLGVVKEYRRNGIATLLLDHFIDHLTNHSFKECKAVYLHVLTTNSVAINFYEKRHFRRHLFLPLYYFIDGEEKDGYSYVLYINGGHPPWLLFDYLSPFYHMVNHVNPWRCVKRFVQTCAGVVLRFLPGGYDGSTKSLQHLASC